MKIYLDLRRVLPVGKTVKQLAKEIGISVNELKHLMETEPTTINQSHLNKVCNFLIREELVDESNLPGVLFSKRDNGFWPLLTKRRRIGLVYGCRQDEKDGLEVVSAADSILQCNLVSALTHNDGQPRPSQQKKPRQAAIDPQLVLTWDFDGANHNAVMRESRKFYQAFSREREDCGLVLFGSIKSNPLVDLTIANCFRRAKAFEPEHVETPGERSCPVMLRYRKKDPTPPSCCGGVQLSKTQPGAEPGLYYELELGKDWAHIPSNDRTDSALVFYLLDHQRKRLEMVLGGFSGHATRSLADYLRNEDVDSFWPPIISDRDLDVGAFVVEFTYRRPRNGGPKPNRGVSKVDVIPLAKEVLVDRVKPAKRSRRKSTTSSTDESKKAR